jgi:tRNA uridine 5-carboxymethylaminomethyl modification enzyme
MVLKTHVGRVAGAVSDKRWSHFERVRNDIAEITKLLKSVKMSPQVCCSPSHSYHYSELIGVIIVQGWTAHGFVVQHDGVLRRFVHPTIWFHCLTCHFQRI